MNRLIVCVMACVATGCGGGAGGGGDMGGGGPATLGAGDVVLEVAGDARTITLRRNGMALLAFPSDGFQLGTAQAPLPDGAIVDPYWYEDEDGLIKPHPAVDVTWRDVKIASLRSASSTEVVIALGFDGGATAALTIDAPAAGRFAARLVPESVPPDQAIAIMRLRPRASTSEGFYGLGEWGDTVNHRGRMRPMQLEADLAIENGSDENHVPVPLLVGSNGWGLFVESHLYGAFDVARKAPDLIEISYGTANKSTDGLAFHLFAAARPLDVTKLYYDVTGYPRLPAQWALGPWLWRNDSRDQAQFLDDLEKVRDLDLATSGFWIDRPYATAVETFDWNPGMWTDPQMMINRAHDMGIKMGLWQAPYLEPTAKPYVDEATQKGYFVPKVGGPLLNGWSTPIDFTNPVAYAWWQTQLHKYTDMGIEGWKLDFAEDVSVTIGARAGWKFADGSDERTMHDGYTLLYHKLYQELLPKDGSWMMCRTGRWGDQVNVSVIWPGDMDATFTQKEEMFTLNGKTYRGVGGLPTTVAYGLSLGVSGFPFFAADTGGFLHSPPNKELFVRWTEQTALSPVMHVGDATSQMPWEWNAQNGRDQQALDIYRTYARLHMRLFPYEWTLAQNIAKDGRPIVRALGLAYPELGVHPSDTYFFGDDLLVAPVVAAGQTSRDVILPPGDWIDWWDGTVYSGGPGGMTGGNKVTIPAPLEKLPLLMRAGAIVPLLRPTIDTMSPTTLPDRADSFATTPGPLYVRIEPHPMNNQSSSYTVYDGTKIEGTGPIAITPGTVFTLGAMLEIIRTSTPAMVTLDGTALPPAASQDALAMQASGWYWEAATGGTLWVKVPAGDHSVNYCGPCGK